jgi:hypothetical protein
MVFANILWFCRHKPRPRWTSVRNEWPARARDLLLGQPRVRATLHIPDCDQWCPVVYGGRLLQWGSWGWRVRRLWRRQLFTNARSVFLCFLCVSMVFASLAIRFSYIPKLFMAC